MLEGGGRSQRLFFHMHFQSADDLLQQRAELVRRIEGIAMRPLSLERRGRGSGGGQTGAAQSAVLALARFETGLLQR